MEDTGGEVILFYAPISIEEANSDGVRFLPQLDKDYCKRGELNLTYYCEGTRSVWCKVRCKRVPQIGWAIYGLENNYDWGDSTPVVTDIDYNIKTDEVTVELGWPIWNLREVADEILRYVQDE